jgi:hypothetical protein
VGQGRAWPDEHDMFSVDRRAYHGTNTHGGVEIFDF